MINWKPYVGAAFLFVGCGLAPMAWMFERTLWFVAFTLLFVGSMLMILAYEEAKKEGSYMFSGWRRGADRSLPGDIHDYSGWGSGGRTTSSRESGHETRSLAWRH